jgi:hypothetical protein
MPSALGAPSALVTLQGLSGVEAIAEGGKTDALVYALLEDGSVWCSRSSIQFQGSDRPEVQLDTPRHVPALDGATGLVAAQRWACTPRAGGAPMCVEATAASDSVTFQPVELSASGSSLSFGQAGICFYANSAASCYSDWELSVSGQEPSIERVEMHIPADVGPFRSVSLGGSANGCGLVQDGQVYCSRVHAELDGGLATVDLERMEGLPNSTLVTSGYFMSCASGAQGISCWAHEGFEPWRPIRVE